MTLTNRDDAAAMNFFQSHKLVNLYGTLKRTLVTFVGQKLVKKNLKSLLAGGFFPSGIFP